MYKNTFRPFSRKRACGSYDDDEKEEEEEEVDDNDDDNDDVRVCKKRARTPAAQLGENSPYMAVFVNTRCVLCRRCAPSSGFVMPRSRSPSSIDAREEAYVERLMAVRARVLVIDALQMRDVVPFSVYIYAF